MTARSFSRTPCRERWNQRLSSVSEGVTAMRGATLFVAGLVVGVTAQALVAQNSNTGVVMMNHVGINVPSIPDAIKYYGDTMGYKEAFRANNPDGTPRLVYLQISKTTFLELQQ